MPENPKHHPKLSWGDRLHSVSVTSPLDSGCSETVGNIDFLWPVLSLYLFVGVSMPIPVIGLHNEDKVFVNGSCVLNEERFVLIGSFVAFFIPLVIMVVTYCLTIQVSWSVCAPPCPDFTFPFVYNSHILHYLCSVSSPGAPEAGHCLPVRGKDFLPAAFAHTSNDKYITASGQHRPPPSDQHTLTFRLTRYKLSR